jgi:predicted RNA-binding protein YlxR (DUF448 family)
MKTNQPDKKKEVTRKCIGCNTIRSKKELIRIVRTPEGEIKLDPTGRANGRGAYICRQEKCLKAAIDRKGLERSFKIPAGQNTVDHLIKEFKELGIE